MSNLFRKSLIYLIPVILLKVFSCTPESCFEETEAVVKVSLYDFSLKSSSAPDSITIYGMNKDDSKIYNRRRNVTVAMFPLNAASDSSVFIVEINGVTDIIIFRHSSFTHLISKECGYTFYHTISDVIPTYNEIDSISIRKNSITTANEENIRIYY